MATATVLQLPQAQSLTGAELLELTQNGRSVRGSTAQVASLTPAIAPTGPNGVVVAYPSAGANNNYTAAGQFGATTGFLDLNASGGACNITGLLAGFDGQIVVITNIGAALVTLNALNANSLTANQFRMVADLVLPQWSGQSFKYSAVIGKWVAL